MVVVVTFMESLLMTYQMKTRGNPQGNTVELSVLEGKNSEDVYVGRTLVVSTMNIMQIFSLFWLEILLDCT
jgi:hypothetical protein